MNHRHVHFDATFDQLIDLIQYALAMGANSGCTDTEARVILLHWQAGI